MLTKLTIKNIALIECASIELTNGLNVLSGETGSGKSVIIESLNFALGAKADKSLIRSGESECLVVAEFDVSDNSSIKEIFNEFDFDYEDTLIISRKFNAEGKSSIKINGNSATVGMLRKFTSILVDVHGQSEHFHLLKNSNQLSLIDKFGGEQIADVKLKLHNTYSEYKNVVKELNDLGGDESARMIRLDVLNYHINEIEKANLLEGEEEELKALREKLKNQEKILTALNSIKSAINDEGGASDIISNASRSSATISGFSAQFEALNSQLLDLYSNLDDVIDSVNSLIDDFDFSEYNIDEIEDRLDVIKTLKKKYGSTISEIYSYLENAKIERNKLENFNENAKILLDKQLKLQGVLYDYYLSLSDLRKQYSKVFSNNVLAELKELGMSSAKFMVEFNDFIDFESCKFNSNNGVDDIEFLFSANLGEPLKSLSSVISGGEMSRFMLAIKAQTAKYNDISTFIFDEIDAGISGKIAKVVSEKLFKISKDVQIIAITHLPQISVMADNNLLIYKTETQNKTITNVKKLGVDDKVFEIARLVGGDSDSQTAIKHAKEMINSAENYKLNN